VSLSCMVTVWGSPIITSFSASPTSISQGGSTTLNWAVSGTGLTVSLDNQIGTVGSAGSVVVKPGSTTTYTLTAHNGAGTVTNQCTVTVVAPPAITAFAASPATIPVGQTSLLSRDIRN
jgi:hypothetical protein